MPQQSLEPSDPIYQVSAGFTQTGFPAPGLPRTMRYITGHNKEGKGVFLSEDSGDHHRPMGADQAIANILYSTAETPVNLDGDSDIKYARDNEPGLHIAAGSVVRMIDFGPNVASPMHRAICLGYGVVLEGEFKLTLDSGEQRIMRRGDFSIQRATSHAWHNITGGGTLPGRMLWVLLDCKDVTVNGEKIGSFLNQLAGHDGRYDVSGEDASKTE